MIYGCGMLCSMCARYDNTWRVMMMFWLQCIVSFNDCSLLLLNLVGCACPFARLFVMYCLCLRVHIRSRNMKSDTLIDFKIENDEHKVWPNDWVESVAAHIFLLSPHANMQRHRAKQTDKKHMYNNKSNKAFFLKMAKIFNKVKPGWTFVNVTKSVFGVNTREKNYNWVRNKRRSIATIFVIELCKFYISD